MRELLSVFAGRGNLFRLRYRPGRMRCRVVRWRVAAKEFGTLVDQHLSHPDFLMGGCKLVSAVLNHLLRLLELGQGDDSNIIGVIHQLIIPKGTLERRLSRR